jgi:hypothetical protein
MRHPHSVGHRWIIALAVAVVLAAAFPRAVQSAPTADDPIAPASPGPVKVAQTRHLQRGRRTKPLVNLDLNFETSVPMGGDQLVPAGAPGEGLPWFWGGALAVNATNKLRIFEDRINHEDVAGQRYKKGLPSYSGLDWDIEYRTGAAYAPRSDLQVEEAYVYRYRACCPNAGDPTNTKPRVKHGWLTGITGRLGPRTAVGRPLQLHAEATWVYHHPDIGLAQPGGTPVVGDTWIYKMNATVFVPFFGRKFVPWFLVEQHSDFFNNQLTPSITNRTEYGFNLNASPLISYRLYVKNDHEPGGDVSHKIELYFVTTLKLHS